MAVISTSSNHRVWSRFNFQLSFAHPLVFGLGATAQQSPNSSQTDVPELLQQFVLVTDEILLRPKPENWITFRNGYHLWGYSVPPQGSWTVV